MASVRTSHSVMDQVSGSQSTMPAQPAPAIFDRNKIDFNGANYEKSLFSSSMSDMFARKLRLSPNEIMFRQPVAVVQPRFDGEEPLGPLEEIEAQTIGDLLPNDDELLAGIHDLDCVVPTCNGDDSEDLDLFSSIGGLELGVDEMLNDRGVNRTLDFLASVSNDHVCTNNSFTGEHPCGEHPSRTLFVRNININIEDCELKALFEQYGDIRELYTACKPRGFFIISYYDIRAARNAMRALQNKIFRGRNLDVHYSVPKDNSSEKDVNREAFVVLNLDSSVTNDELRQNFGVYGEIKEIRENPHKQHQKLIEFYDVRAAEAALRALNRSDIAGKRTKLEASRLGGARRLFPNFSMELEHEQSIGTPPQGVLGNSLAGCYAPVSIGALTSNGLENGPVSGLHSSSRGSIGLGQLTDNGFLGHSHGVPHSLPTLNRVSSISGQSGVIDPSSPGHIKFGFQSMANFHPHSLPDYSDNLSNGALNFNSPSTIASGINALAAESFSNRRSTVINKHSFDGGEGSLSSANGSGHIHGRQYLWGNTNNYHPHSLGTMMWQGSSSFVNGARALPVPGLNGSPSQMISSSQHHHVGSAPANNPSWDHRRGFVGDVEPSLFHPGSLGSMGFSGNNGLHPLELASHNIFSHVGGNGLGHPPISSSSIGIPSPQQRGHLFSGRSHINPSMASSFDGRSELRLRNRRNDANVSQIDNKKLYELEIDRIKRGEDGRTTLMIKNIPNKYTSKMLLAAIDERHRGTYDFIYLPIDFKNKCNVGYAFINMIDTMHIVPFYEAFNGKKWEKFNSEKVALLAYARIQGKSALIAHFQNSSLMNEDKRCRPILFHSKGPNAGDQEPFPLGSNIRSRPGKSKTTNSEETHQGNSPPSSINIDESTNGRESPPGFSSD